MLAGLNDSGVIEIIILKKVRQNFSMVLCNPSTPHPIAQTPFAPAPSKI
jgi:hypothetical protein